MKWYNWIGLISFILNITGIYTWAWEKYRQYEVNPADFVIIGMVSMILFFLNRDQKS